MPGKPWSPRESAVLKEQFRLSQQSLNANERTYEAIKERFNTITKSKRTRDSVKQQLLKLHCSIRDQTFSEGDNEPNLETISEPGESSNSLAGFGDIQVCGITSSALPF
jgi:hypothetical protein